VEAGAASAEATKQAALEDGSGNGEKGRGPKMFKCSSCNAERPKPDFRRVERRKPADQRKCLFCLEPTVRCDACERKKPRSSFAVSQLAYGKSSRCMKCVEKALEAKASATLECTVCSATKPVKEFAKRQRKTSKGRKCRACSAVIGGVQGPAVQADA